MRWFFRLALLVLWIWTSGATSASSLDKVGVLYHGDALEQDHTSLLLFSDPMLDVTRVPSHAWRSDYDLKTIRRFLRLYMPRRYEELREYGLIILSDASRTIFSTKELAWFQQGVLEDGVCLTMIGGYDSFGGSHGAPVWEGTTVEEVLPVTLTDTDTGTTPVRMNIKDAENALVNILDSMNPPPFLGMNLVETKPGSRLLSTGLWMRGEHPLMVYWDLGEARSFALTSDWNGGWGANLLDWEDYPTYSSVITYFASRIKLPEDMALFQNLRNLFFEYPTRRGLATSLLEFVEKFGVRSSPILLSLGQIDSMRKEAEDLFLMQEYEEALLKLEEVDEEFVLLSRELVSLKEKALFWVYVVEWFAVTGTAMVCGGILWTLMVKRRLYREVKVTRAGISEG